MSVDISLRFCFPSTTLRLEWGCFYFPWTFCKSYLLNSPLLLYYELLIRTADPAPSQKPRKIFLWHARVCSLNSVYRWHTAKERFFRKTERWKGSPLSSVGIDVLTFYKYFILVLLSDTDAHIFVQKEIRVSPSHVGSEPSEIQGLEYFVWMVLLNLSKFSHHFPPALDKV